MVCILIKCLLAEIDVVALMASSLSLQARVSAAHLKSIQHMESRPEAQCSLHLYLISVVFPPESQPHTYPTGETPSVPAAASLIQTQRGPKHFFAGNHAEPAGIFCHLSFHFQLAERFPGSRSREYFKGPIRKNSIISSSRRHCPGIQSSRPKWKKL